jgi:hypothetical protein
MRHQPETLGNKYQQQQPGKNLGPAEALAAKQSLH